MLVNGRSTKSEKAVQKFEVSRSEITEFVENMWGITLLAVQVIAGIELCIKK